MKQASCVAFRVDAEQEIGLGHLRRCLTLADQLGDMGCKILIVCRNPVGPEISPLAAPHVVCSLMADSRLVARGSPSSEELWDADATLSVIARCEVGTSWVVLDSYRLGHCWERRVRGAGYRVMVIDDFRDRLHHADLLVSDSEIPFEPVLNERGAFAKTLVGREYALIGPEYAYCSMPFARGSEPKRLLISYGGSDSTGETEKAISAVASLRRNPATRDVLGRVDVVIGQLSRAARRIASAAKGVPDVIVQQAPASLAKLMRAADLVLTAGGNTMVEALALRKPCLVTVTDENQSLMADRLAVERMIRLLGASASVTHDDVAGAVVSALADYDAFAAHVASRPLFDHLGAQRVAAVMLASLERGVPQ